MGVGVQGASCVRFMSFYRCCAFFQGPRISRRCIRLMPIQTPVTSTSRSRTAHGRKDRAGGAFSAAGSGTGRRSRRPRQRGCGQCTDHACRPLSRSGTEGRGRAAFAPCARDYKGAQAREADQIAAIEQKLAALEGQGAVQAQNARKRSRRGFAQQRSEQPEPQPQDAQPRTSADETAWDVVPVFYGTDRAEITFGAASRHIAPSAGDVLISDGRW